MESKKKKKNGTDIYFLIAAVKEKVQLSLQRKKVYSMSYLEQT